jgi:hypothetical protein
MQDWQNDRIINRQSHEIITFVDIFLFSSGQKIEKLICQLIRKERTSTTSFVLIKGFVICICFFDFYLESEQNSLHGISNRSMQRAFKILLELRTAQD